MCLFYFSFTNSFSRHLIFIGKVIEMRKICCVDNETACNTSRQEISISEILLIHSSPDKFTLSCPIYCLR